MAPEQPDEKGRPKSAVQACSPESQWSSSPRTLKESSPSWLFRIVPHIMLAAVPSYFAILGALICSLQGMPESESRRIVVQAVRVTSTLWPIAFAAVVGQTLRTLALYKVEKGAKLGMIDTLANSQTLVNTLKQCWNLRMLNLWTIIVILVWCLSPIGGQATLRSVTLRKGVENAEYPLLYHPINNVSVMADPWGGASSRASAIAKIRALFGAALSSPTSSVILSNGSSSAFDGAVERLGGSSEAVKSAARDTWGNVRIPFVHLLPGYDTADPYDWLDVPTDEIPPYESLVGVPIRGMPEATSGNMSLQVSTFYSVLNCGSWTNSSEWIAENMPDFNVTDALQARSDDSVVFSAYANVFMYANRTYYQNDLPVEDQTPLFDVLFGTALDQLAICRISTAYVDIEIGCVRASNDGGMACTSQRARYAESRSSESNATILNQLGSSAEYFLSIIPWLIPSYHVGQMSPMEMYLQDPPTGFQDTVGLSYVDDMVVSTLPMEVFQTRLSLLINTLCRLSYNASTTVGIDGNDVTNRSLDDRAQFENATGSWTAFTQPTYRVSMPWILVYWIATAVVAIFALCNIVVRTRIRAPDFLGSISSLTRESPYCDVPVGQSGSDGVERTRLLKEKWVRVQDVHPDREHGKIALSDDKNLASTNLSWERRYE